MINAASRTTGSLYIVATPIGNREDISFRAVSILKSVDCILAEDTRHSKPLLSSLGIETPLTSFHAHNESSKEVTILTQLTQGLSIALISDAGTPLISDPGYSLVRQARALGIPVIPIPGACAFIAALSASGLPCDRFTFVGFLPAKSAARQTELQTLRRLNQTIIVYESTHRILDCLQDIATVYDAHTNLVLAKELTKTFETFISGTSADIQAWLNEDTLRCKGEFILIISPNPVSKETDARQVLSLLLTELPLKPAVKLACQLTGEAKNELYKWALAMTKG